MEHKSLANHSSQLGKIRRKKEKSLFYLPFPTFSIKAEPFTIIYQIGLLSFERTKNIPNIFCQIFQFQFFIFSFYLTLSCDHFCQRYIKSAKMCLKVWMVGLILAIYKNFQTSLSLNEPTIYTVFISVFELSVFNKF